MVLLLHDHRSIVTKENLDIGSISAGAPPLSIWLRDVRITRHGDDLAPGWENDLALSLVYAKLKNVYILMRLRIQLAKIIRLLPAPQL
jgi:hypothetical protein